MLNYISIVVINKTFIYTASVFYTAHCQMLQIQDIEDFFTMQNVITSNTTQRLLYFMCRKM